jgi:hypothetical protein
MRALMSYQIAQLTESPITHFTGVTALITMDALMYFQSALVKVRLTTHITNIRGLAIM